jgi:ketosteroid isomerase-like protein
MRKLLLLALMFGITLPALAEDDEAKIKATVENRYKEFVAALNKKDVSTVTNFFDENAVLMPAMEEPVIGKVAINSWYNTLFNNPAFAPFTVTLNWNSFHSVGGLAIETSVFDGDVTREDKHVHAHGKNLLVWKKQSDGSWKILRYVYDLIPPKKQ